MKNENLSLIAQQIIDFSISPEHWQEAIAEAEKKEDAFFKKICTEVDAQK